MRYIFILLFFSAWTKAQQQNNPYLINGKIKAVDSDSMAGISVKISSENYSTNIIVERDGAFEASLPSDILFPVKLSVASVKYETYSVAITQKDFKNNTYSARITLSAKRLEEVVVKTRANKEDKRILLKEQQNALQMQQSVGAQDLKRRAAFNVEQGIARMSGITAVKERGIYVRGLDDRYNNMSINGLSLASPDPDNKIIPLDLIPSDIVKNIYVYKTFNPSLYGDFAGATIALETKDYPEKAMTEVSLQVYYNTNSTGKLFKQLHANSFLNFIGQENASRAIPDIYSPARLGKQENVVGEDAKKLFGATWSNTSFSAPPAVNFSVKHGNKFLLKNGNNIGYYASFQFRNNYLTQTGVKRSLNSTGIPLNDFKLWLYSYETQKSGLATLSYTTKYGWSLRANFIYINNTSNLTAEVLGTNLPLSIGNFFSRDNAFEYSEIIAGQLLSEYVLHEKHTFKLGIGYSIGKNDAPDRKLLRTENSGAQSRYITENGINPFVQFLLLNNKEVEGYIKYAYKINKRHSVKIGLNLTAINYDMFNRVSVVNFDADKIGQLGYIDTDKPDEFFNDKFSERSFYYTDPADPRKQIRVNQLVAAVYANYILSFDKLTIDAGLREELFFRDILFRRPNVSIFDPFEKQTYNPSFLIPSLNVKYRLDQKSNLRFTASNTITIPRLREILPLIYEDGNGNSIQGNEDLKFSNVINVDIKYEFFPKNGELVSFNLFSKYIKAPIERIFAPLSTGRSIRFENFDMAYIIGIEHEVNLNVGRILKNKALEAFLIGYNISWMYTNTFVDLSKPDNKTKFGFLTSTSRPLQGASEWIANIDLSYQKKIHPHWETTTTVLFNSFSQRIFSVGVEGANNIIEMPQYNLDFLFNNRIQKHWNIRFAVTNILNTTILFNQYPVEGIVADPTILRNDNGVTFSIACSYLL